MLLYLRLKPIRTLDPMLRKLRALTMTPPLLLEQPEVPQAPDARLS